ncbi:MAG: molybdopterin-dependent oxidoreductase [Burkholderiales bacterium]|nr:MAG: molybdopterin-dependent oxidoreductase [Burkholderiales bacterium]
MTTSDGANPANGAQAADGANPANRAQAAAGGRSAPQAGAKADDRWIPTVCLGCYNCCGIRVRRVGERVVDVVGDPASPNSRGHICAKGKARFFDLYHPHRVLRPLRRRNPEKGIGVDPQWQEIGWDEALDLVAERLRATREQDPRGLVIAHFDLPAYGISKAFGAAFGTPNLHWNRADYCGAAPHTANLLINGSFNGELDFDRCNYIVLWGTQLGHLVETIPLHAAHRIADARARGARMVVIDPFCTNASAKADEWVPLRPGTDGALALAMLRVMVVELGTIDEPFLRRYTNGPYLVQDDGHYLRDAASGKPLVWDTAAARAVPHDAVEPQQAALEGEYPVGGGIARPAFEVLRRHLAQVSVESMAEITTVPAATIRRLAREFCAAASIGSTVEIDGQRLPLRPAAIHFKRGSGAHKGGFHTMLAIHLINVMVGNIDVPGGQRGVNPIGPYWSVEQDDDGMLIPSEIITKYSRPYPPAQARTPTTFDLKELFPAALFTRGLYPLGIAESERFGIPYRASMLLHGRTNLMMNSHSAEAMAAVLRSIPFQVSFADAIDETVEFADVVLPDAHDYERWDLFPANDPYAFITPGPGQWFWLMRQPVLEPPDGVRPWTEVYLELAERIGIADRLYEIGSQIWGIGEAHRLEPGVRHSMREIAERQARTIVGPEFSTDELRETACLITRDKTLAEAFPRPFLEARIPIYFEHLIGAGEQVREVAQRLGLEHWDVTPYAPLLGFFACEALAPDGDYDLFIVNFKLPFQTFSISAENPWIDEISRANPYAYHVMINRRTAEAKGLRDGDPVVVESRHGAERATLRVTELIHPECVGIPGMLGHWAQRKTVSYRNGPSFNNLLPPPSENRIDVVTGQVDSCVRVRVRRLEERAR